MKKPSLLWNSRSTRAEISPLRKSAGNLGWVKERFIESHTLKARRFFYQDKSTKLYGLGVRTLEIGMVSKREKFLRNSMAPFLMDLSERCGKRLTRPCGNITKSATSSGWNQKRCSASQYRPARDSPVHRAATGKIFLSYMSDEDIRQIYARKNALRKRTERSIGSLDMLIEEIEKVRVNQVAIDDEETLVGVYCVASPELSPKGECVAAISISAPKNG